nr:hypothetical protein [Maricaulis sp.]
MAELQSRWRYTRLNGVVGLNIIASKAIVHGDAAKMMQRNNSIMYGLSVAAGCLDFRLVGGSQCFELAHGLRRCGLDAVMQGVGSQQIVDDIFPAYTPCGIADLRLQGGQPVRIGKLAPIDFDLDGWGWRKGVRCWRAKQGQRQGGRGKSGHWGLREDVIQIRMSADSHLV